MTRTLRFEVVYPHPPERVWQALTDRAALAEWLMENDFEPRVGHRFQFRAAPQPGWSGVVNCEVLEVEPPRRLAYTWESESLRTVVRFSLEPAGKGTRLRLEHSGFRGWRGLTVSFILAQGWRKKILREQLPRVLERLADREAVRT